MPSLPTTGYSDIVLRSEPVPGIRYVSGRIVYDEAFVDGLLVARYWSPMGQIWPEIHLPVARLQAAIRQGPLAAFGLGIEGQDLTGGWRWAKAGEEEDQSGLRAGKGASRQAAILLSHSERPIDVRVCTRLDGGEWLVRWLEITNRGQRATGITSLSPMAGCLWAHRYDEHLPVGTTTPFELAYNHGTRWGHEGDIWFEPLTAGTRTFDGDRNGKSGWSRPAFWVRDLANGQTFVCELAWSGNWQFEINCHLDTVCQEGQLCFAMGLAPTQDPLFAAGLTPWSGEVLRVLSPGETVRTPAVHIGHFQCNVDSIVQSSHHHVRHVVMPKAPLGREIEIETNHRGYLCDRENEPGLKRDIDLAAKIGAEMYVIDAGWYGNEPNRWWDNTGDWFAGPWLPNGLEPVVEHVHKRGMRFGLWVEIEAAGANSTLRKEHPDWLLRRHGRLVGEGTGEGRSLDLTKPEVAAWAEAEIERIIERYDLDMFRIDHNHSMGAGGTCEREGFIENTHWRYYETLYAIFDRVRARHPDVVLQNCAGGGGRLDIGILQRFHNTEPSDWMRQPRGLLILNGLTMAIPPEVMLRTFGTEVGEHALDADLDAQLRLVCLCRPIFRGTAPSVQELDPVLEDRIVHHLQLYKDFIRPVMKDGLVFHHTPWLPLQKATPWCVLEYASEDRMRAVVGLFRLCAHDSDSYHLHPRGLARARKYRVVFDNTGDAVVATGMELAGQGMRVPVPGIFSSELLLFEAVD